MLGLNGEMSPDSPRHLSLLHSSLSVKHGAREAQPQEAEKKVVATTPAFRREEVAERKSQSAQQIWKMSQNGTADLNLPCVVSYLQFIASWLVRAANLKVKRWLLMSARSTDVQSCSSDVIG